MEIGERNKIASISQSSQCMETCTTSKLGLFFHSHPERLPSGHLLFYERNTACFLYLIFNSSQWQSSAHQLSKASNPKLVTAVVSAKMSWESTENGNLQRRIMSSLSVLETWKREQSEVWRFGKEMLCIEKKTTLFLLPVSSEKTAIL